MKPKFLHAFVFPLSISLMSSMLSTGVVSATDIVWGTNLGAGPWIWNTGANWTGGTAPVIDTDRGDLRKDWTAAATINLNAATTTNGILFDDTGASGDVGVTIGNGGTAANTLTLAGTAPVIQGSGSTLTVGTVLAGTTAWSKTGAGTVVLNNAANTITGTATVVGGVLQIRDGTTNTPAVFNNLTGKSIIVQSGATLDLPRLHTSTNQGITWTLPPVSLEAGSTLRFRASTGSNTHGLAANLSNAGSTTINNNGGAFSQDINLTGVLSGTGTINLLASSGSGSSTTTRTLTLNNTGTTFSGNWFVDYTGTTSDDFVALRSGAAGALGTGSVSLDDRARLINNAANGINSLAGVSLLKSTSFLDLNGSNSWNNTSASLTLNAGTVTLATSNSAIGALNLAGSATINSNGGTLAFNSILVTAGTTSGTGVLVPATSATIANTGAPGSATIANSLELNNSGIGFNIADTNLAGSDLFLTGPVNSSAGFTKSGVGALSFNNTTNVSGLVTHNGGIIQISSTPTKSFTGGLTGTGQINVGGTGVVTLAGASAGFSGTIIVADAASLAGEAVTNANLTLGSATGANLWPDFATPTGSFTANNITLNGVNTVRFNTFPSPGTYTLLKYNGLLTGTAANFNAPFRGASIDTTGGVGDNEITLTIGAAASLVWNNAATTSVWDNAISANWNNSGSDDVFFEQDSVIFNDSPGTDQAISITDTVVPASVTFPASNDTVDYAISGGSISGLGNLVKSGDAILTLASANSYSGGTTLNEGRLRVGADNALGSGTLTINGGVLGSNSPSPWALANPVVLNTDPTFGNATDNGVLTLSGSVSLNANRTITTLSDVTLSGVVGGAFSLTKSGAGTLALTGANTYSGPTTVSAGTLSASLSTTLNSLGSGPVTIDAGATLQINNLNTATATGPTFANTVTGSGLLKYDFAAGTTARNSYITGLAGFTGTLQLTNSGSTADKLNAAAGINAPGASVIVDSGSQLHIVTNPSTFAGVSLNGSGNSENRGGLRIANTLNAPITLAGSTTIGTEGGTVNGTIASGAPGTQTLTVGTINSTGNSTFTGAIGGGTGTIELIKVAAGTMTLAAANTYTGDTFIDEGTLNLTGSIAGDLYVSSLATAAAVAGEGSVGGTMTFGSTAINASLTINPLTAGALGSTGIFSVAEPGTVVSVSFSPAPAAAGTYTVLSHGGTTATPANFALSSTGYRPVTFDTTTDPSKVTITTVSKDLAWEGNASAVWDVDTASNWESLPGPVSEKFYHLDSVTFNDSATMFAPTLAVTVNPTSVTFDNTANAYTLTGAGAIAGAATLTKSGSGSVTLSTPNTFTGAVAVNAGKLLLGNAAALGDSAAGAKTVTINSGGQLDINNQSPTARTYSFKIAGAGDGTGALVNSNGGGVASNAGVLNLELLDHATIGGASRFDIGWAGGAGGTITGNGKTLTKTGANQINLRGDASGSPITIQVNQGTLGIEDNNNAFGGTTGSVTVASGATVASYGARTIATPITLNGGATLGHLGGGTPTWTGDISLAGNASINLAAAANTTNLDGIISGTGGITVLANGGTLNLEGANTFSGGLTVGPTSATATTVKIGVASTLDVNSGNLVQVANTVASGTAIQTLNVDGSVTNAGSLRVARPGVLNLRSGGSWSQSGAAVVEGVGGYTATMNVNSGSSFTHTGSSTFKLSGAPGNSGQALLNLSGTFTTSAGFEQTTVPTTGYGRVTMTGGSLVLGANVPQMTTGVQFVLGTGGGTIDTAAFSTAISANISGTGNSLTKLGTGTLTLSGTNSYTGPTWLDFGTLAGNGAAGSAITAEADTTIAPGTGIGTYASAGATLKAGSTLAIQIDSTTDTADKLVSSAAVDITGAGVSFTEIGTGIIPAGTELVILDYTGTTLTGTFTGYAEGASITVGSNSFTLSYTDSSRVTLTSTTVGSAYDSWIDGFFTGITNPLTVGPNADPDGDGVANLIEFLTNGVPNSNGDKGLLWVGTSGNQLVMSLAIRGAGTTFAGSPSPATTVDGITASIEGSLDLGGFTSAVSGTTFVLPATWSPTPPAGHSYHSFKLDASSGLAGKGFMRLNATQP